MLLPDLLQIVQTFLEPPPVRTRLHYELWLFHRYLWDGKYMFEGVPTPDTGPPGLPPWLVSPGRSRDIGYTAADMHVLPRTSFSLDDREYNRLMLFDLDDDIVDDWVARFDKGTAEDMVLNLRTGRMVFSGNCTE